MAKKKESNQKEFAKRVEELEKEIEQLKEKYLRALADYQNLLRRFEEEKSAIAFEASSQVIRDFLEVLDDMEKAEEFVKDKGLSLVKEKFKKLLEKWGVEEIEVEGRSFDPEVAEVVDTVEGEEENKVVKVFQKGYKRDGKVIRVAKVQVSKKVKS